VSIPEVADPGSGFVTLNCTLDVCELTVPVAVNWVLETKVVLNAVPPMFTTAPFTKLLPFNVTVKLPTSICGGAAEESCGIGFHKVVTVDAVSDLCDVTVAAIVTVLGFGSVADAV
jgi:hypothetical protein